MVPTAGAPTGSGRRRNLTLAVLLTASFMGILDVLIVNVAAPSIQRDLGADFADIQLVISGYVLAYAAALATGGRLGDAYGQKPLFLAGLLAFTALSAGCAAAPTVGVLIVLRIGQGLAASLMLPQVLSLIQVIVPARERGRALALYAATLGLGAVVGQLVGGALIRADLFGLGWRSVFLVNVPVGLFAAACVPALVPAARRARPTRQRFDLPGPLLTATAMALLVYPLVQGSDDGWPPWVWPAFAGSALSLAALWQVERRREASGRVTLMPPSLFRDRGFRIGLGAALAFYSGNYGLFLLLAYVFQEGLRLSPFASGVGFLPLGVGFAAASLSGRHLVSRYGPMVLLAGAGVVAAGYLLLVLTLLPGPAGSGRAEALAMAPALLVGGAGQGLVSAPLLGAILATVRPGQAGAGSGIVLTVNQLASSLGVAVVGAVFVALLGADPQDPSARRSAGDYTAALAGCSWLLLGLALATGVLLRFLVPTTRVPAGGRPGEGGSR
ncbi:MFS transporter [Kitasatospora aureofaciens]|uniref:MFS transporter n=1 Tax=Kitasatospora aureofaciens TaxID=1894 RepID=UPI001C454990|nr:MFS transporter [Kitasatospora aureofaciens]MBV6701907.1 MFS transporter [Kitasatospora aureofaciens]